MDRALEPSYVFLGMVLALIGVIFLLVLYLNRKGIKKWIYNIRDACRDHMEGYHYRYEINSDPRLANLSLNSDFNLAADDTPRIRLSLPRGKGLVAPLQGGNRACLDSQSRDMAKGLAQSATYSCPLEEDVI
ncbi:trophoblast glycoprotein [Pimephales promelas]|nr:trophoblast glycoprotein [Pimephales promelas]